MGFFSGGFGSVIGAVGSLIGGGINANNAEKQMAAQREFAQNGLRWKVADAKAAGIHPLAALGAQTFSYNPVATGDYGISEALGRMGQGISRAQEAKELAVERALDVKLKNAQIDNVLAQTDAVKAQTMASLEKIRSAGLPPPMPKTNAKTGLISPEGAATHIWDMGHGNYSILWNPNYTQTIGDEAGQVFNIANAAKEQYKNGVYVDPESGVSYVYNPDTGWWNRLSALSSQEAARLLGNPAPVPDRSPNSHFMRNKHRYGY